MAKIIGFCGAPGAGKTSLAFKTALETYQMLPNTSIIFISSDINTPTMAMLFAHYKKEDMHSLSKVLDNATILPETVLGGTITIKGMRNFGCLGFTAGENKFSFPTPTADKIDELFSSMSRLVDYIFVDCTNDSTDRISQKAISEADTLVRIVTPDLKSLAWYTSNKNLVRLEEEHLYNVVNVNEKDIFLPIEETCTMFKANATLIPYCKEIKQQSISGTLSEKARNSKYNKSIHKLADLIINEKTVQIKYDAEAGANAAENFDNAEYEGGVLM